MQKKKGSKERYNFLIDKTVYEDFSLICDELGLIRSRNIEKHLQKFIEENMDILKEVKKKK